MVLWITGLSGAGKTTLIEAIHELLKPRMPQTILLDGDVVRQLFGDDLDYRESSRRIQIHRIQRLAKFLSEQNSIVLVAALYAHSDLLRWNRENLRDYFEVYIDAPLDLVMTRDAKGLYAKAVRNEMPHVVGIDIPWHAPERPDFVVDARKCESPMLIAERIVAAVPRFSTVATKSSVMAELHLTRDQYLELEKIGLGTFRPLSGFMTEDEFVSVVESLRLPSGEVFPLPVVLDVKDEDARRLHGQPHVVLVFDGEQVGEVEPRSIFGCDKTKVARQVFGTSEMAHPGVRNFIRGGDKFIGGPVRLTHRVRLNVSDYELTPEQARAAFASRGWKTIVGFQTRNVPHRSHEYLQRVALEHVDGIFIQPLVGRKKANDYTPQSIIAGYQTLISQFYRPDRVVFGILSTAMRYAGPREAMFHAIIRRNYGCTHFIIGRDHAGVGGYYGKYEAHDLVGRYADELGIAIMNFCGPFHCRLCDGIVTERTCPHIDSNPAAVTEISGTIMRALLLGGEAPAPHLMRPEIVESLRGIPLFVTEDE